MPRFFLFQAASDGFHRGGYGREMRALSRPRVARIAALSRCASSACPRRLREASLPSNALEPRPTGSFPRRGDARKKSASDARAHPSSSPSPPLPAPSDGGRGRPVHGAARGFPPADAQRERVHRQVRVVRSFDPSLAAPARRDPRASPRPRRRDANEYTRAQCLFSNRPPSLSSRAFPSTELTAPPPPLARPPLASYPLASFAQAPESRARRGGRQGDALPRL